MKFREDIAESSGSGHYVRIKDGESISGILRGEPQEAWVLWDNKVKTEVPEGTSGAKLNFKINFIVKDGPSYTCKILEGGMQIYKQLAALAKEWELEETVIIISRDGSGLDTEYTVMPAPPKQQATKDALDFISKLELHELAPKTEPQKAPPSKRY